MHTRVPKIKSLMKEEGEDTCRAESLPQHLQHDLPEEGVVRDFLPVGP